MHDLDGSSATSAVPCQDVTIALFAGLKELVCWVASIAYAMLNWQLASLLRTSHQLPICLFVFNQSLQQLLMLPSGGAHITPLGNCGINEARGCVALTVLGTLQAAAHEAAMAAAHTAGGEADCALRDQRAAVRLAEQGRRAADKRAVSCLPAVQG